MEVAPRTAGYQVVSAHSSLSDSQIDALLIENDGYRRAAALMHEHGWTQAAIARRLGVSWITVHRWIDTDYRDRGRAQQREYSRTRRPGRGGRP